MKLIEVGVRQYRSKDILNESWQQLTESQQIYIGRWETAVWPLVESYSQLLEQNLDPKDIQKIFTSAEQVLNAQGKNTTALGKFGKVTAEVSSKIKTEIERLAQAAQKTQPIQNIDQKFEQLKRQIQKEFSSNPYGRKLLTSIDKWKQFAEENPGKSAFVLGAMTSVLAFASGGVVSGAAIGLFIRLANNVIKGDSLSSAVGKSAKGAAIGAVAGLIGDIFQDNNIEVSGDGELAVSADSGSQSNAVAQSFSSNDEYVKAFAEKIYQEGSPSNLTEPYKDQIVQRIIDNAEVSGDVTNGDVQVSIDGNMAMGFYLTDEEMAEYRNISDQQERLDYVKSIYGEESQDNSDDVDSDADSNKSNFQVPIADDEYATPAEARAAAEKQGLTKYDIVPVKDEDGFETGHRIVSKESIDYLWDRLDAYELNEAPAFLGAIGKAASRAADSIGKAAQKGADKAAAGAKAAGKELGSQVTARKLNRMWKNSGSPTDMSSIINILKSAGLNDQQIGTVSKQARIDISEPQAQPDQVDIPALAKKITDLGLADEVKRILNPKGPEDRQPEAAKVDHKKAQKDFRVRAARAKKNNNKPIRR